MKRIAADAATFLRAQEHAERRNGLRRRTLWPILGPLAYAGHECSLHRSIRRARHDRVDVDVVIDELVRRRHRQHQYRCLGGTVGRQTGEIAFERSRACSDDRPAVLPYHVRDCMAIGIECPVCVDGKSRCPIFRCLLMRDGGSEDAGVGHQDVDSTVGIDCSLDDVTRRRELGDVVPVCDCATPLRFDLLNDGVCAVAEIVHDDLRTLRCECVRVCAAYAAAGARYYRHLALKPSNHPASPLLMLISDPH